MKLFGILLLASYFLAHERETPSHKKSPQDILRSTCVYAGCVGVALIAGASCFWKWAPLAVSIRPVGVLLAVALATFFFKRSPHFMMASALTAFWILNWAVGMIQFISAWAGATLIVFVLQFFYTGIEERILRLDLPAAIRKGPAARLLLLFALAALFAFVYGKAVQVF